MTRKTFIPISQPSITQKEIRYVSNAVKSGWVSSLGTYIDRFEEKFAAYVGSKYALATANGTTALHLAAIASGIQPSDEVIVPDLTFIATANAVAYTGAKVVCVDIDPNSLCISPEAIQKAITPKTKAILPVHLFGHPADMTTINKIAREYNLTVIEDAAESHGAEVLGKKVGALGRLGVFSFYGNKIITSGEGGMITTDDRSLYDNLRLLRDHAMSATKRYWHDRIGYNYRMTNLQAALGLAQLERIGELLKRKRAIFARYKKHLSANHRIKLNQEAVWAKHVYWMVCLEIEGFDTRQRDLFMQKLKAKGIDSRPYFYPVSDMPMYEKAQTPIAHHIYQKGVNVPSYFDLKDSTIDFICDNILRSLKT